MIHSSPGAKLIMQDDMHSKFTWISFSQFPLYNAVIAKEATAFPFSSQGVTDVTLPRKITLNPPQSSFERGRTGGQSQALAKLKEKIRKNARNFRIDQKLKLFP